ncbi:DUF3313 domain-containing protein [Oligoflexia bacterium]|nr:DUF3313 domain-containing protein [Oligoflexia bacterium]
MKSLLQNIALLSILAFTTACSGSLLKAGPAPDSGFLAETGVDAVANENYPFHRVWHPESSYEALSASRRIYVAPVNTDKLQNKSHYFNNNQKEKANSAIADDAVEISQYIQKSFSGQLNKVAGNRFIVEDAPVKDAVVLELALIELTPTDVARNVLGTVVGTFVPGGGLLGIDGAGKVAIEGRLVDTRTGKTLFTFADRETGKMAPLNLNDFSLYSHARDIVDDWAEQLATVLAASGRIMVADSLPVTLMPI